MDQAGPPRDDEPSPGAAEGSAPQASSLAVTDGEPDASAAGATAAAERAPRAGTLPARWVRSRAARQIGILLAFLAVGVLLAWPRGSYLFHHTVPDTRDAAGFVWGFWWVAHQVVHLGNPWSTHYIAAPVGTQLGFDTLLPLPSLVMTPITLAFGPVVSYNLLSALTPGLLAYAMYRVGRLWLPSQLGAVAAGAFFGLGSMLTNQSWYELNLALGALFIPLGLEAAVRLRRRPGWPRAVILGVIMGAALLTDQESSILAGIVVVLALLPWLIFGTARARRTAAVPDDGASAAGENAGDAEDGATAARGPAFWARLWPVALATIVSGVVASPQIIAMGQQAATGGAAFPPHQLAVAYLTYGVGLLGLFSPSPHVATYGLHGPAAFFYQHGILNPEHQYSSGLSASYTPMFGLTLSILAVVGLVVSFRRRNAWLLALLAVGCSLLALGPVLWIGAHQFTPFAQMWDGVRVSAVMPYTWLVRIPGMSNFREAYRFLELGLAGMALLGGAAVNWLRYHAAKPVLAVVLVLCFLELGWSGNPPGTVMPKALRIGTMGTSYPNIDGPIAADHSSSIVVDFPFGIRGGPPVYGPPFAPASELIATIDGHPLADALISRVPSATYNGIANHPFYACLQATMHAPRAILTAGQVSAVARDARQMNVGWVIVWPQQRVPRAISRYLTNAGFTFAYQAHGVKVYRRSATAPSGAAVAASASATARACNEPSTLHYS